MPQNLSLKNLSFGGKQRPEDPHIHNDVERLESRLQALERESHVLECIDRAFQHTNSQEQMLEATLEVLLDAFACDRAWLLHPCDPKADNWIVPMMRTRPEWEANDVRTRPQDNDNYVRKVMAEISDARGAVLFEAGSHPELYCEDGFLRTEDNRHKAWQIRTQIVTQLTPAIGEPWCLGMHRCGITAARFADEDRVLFDRIAKRLAGELSRYLFQAEAEHQQEARADAARALDRLNGVLLQANDIEALLTETLDVFLDIFDCDRAWFFYPNDPEAASWTVPMMRTRPEWEDLTVRQVPQPMDAPTRALIHNVLNRSGPYLYDPKRTPEWFNEAGLLRGTSDDRYIGFHVRSMMTMAIYPKLGSAWAVGLHHCERPVPFTDEQAALFQALSHRITDALTGLLYRRELELNERRMRAVLDHMPAAVYLKGPDGRYLLANQNFRDLCGRPAAPFIGRTDVELVREGIRNPLCSGEVSGILGAEVQRHDQIVPLENGERVFHTIRFALPDHEEAEGGVCSISIDVTDLREKARALEEINRDISRQMEMVRSADRAKTQFLQNMSHELRTPLNAIIGFSEIMKLETFGSIGRDIYRAYAGDIHQAGSYLLSLITDILDVSRAESGHVDLDLQPTDLARLVDACVVLVRERALHANIRVSVDFDADLPEIQCDPVRVKQIILNLLSNAVKYTPSRGRVDVTATKVCDGNLDMLRLTVRDTGIGISKADQARVFEPFFQAAGGEKHAGDGIGLGLAIACGLTRSHGGVIRLDSEPGRGAAFHVILPITPTPSAPEANTPGANAP